MRAFRIATTLLGCILFAGLSTMACAGSDDLPPGSTGTGGGGGTSGIPDQICLLNNCDTDLECQACTKGRTTCLTSEHRCVACAPGSSGNCPGGTECSQYGNCVPSGQTCPTNNGVPTITCDKDDDCSACDPMHQICNTTAHKCVACTDGDTSQCQTTDTCSGGSCAPKCPASCTDDSDCSSCGAPGHEAHACNAHKCAQCSSTTPCPNGETCTIHGTCEATCGIQGPLNGTCDSDAECAGCQASNDVCNKPINGGHGKCGPTASGCSDLGAGMVLPAPFDQVTNLCSGDGDCANVGVAFNVGKLLRDLTGVDQIGDANIDYPMPACASVALPGDVSCGVCVPCRTDADCKPINIDQVALQAFGPLGSIAASYLLDLVFGANDHQIHMYCETVTAGYGVCAPCPGLLNGCGAGGPVTGSGSCDHDTCTGGGPLDPSCDSCTKALCAIDPYCCTTEWDQACVEGVALYCGDTCGTSGNEGCSHNECTSGNKLSPSCSPCTQKICDLDPYCCQTTWDQSCIDQVATKCPEINCTNLGQCDYASQCPNGQGCLWDHSCGPCYADYDCYPQKCNTMTKTCQ